MVRPVERNTIKIGDRVRVIKPQIYRGTPVTKTKMEVGDVTRVTDISDAASHGNSRWGPRTARAHVAIFGAWTEEHCVELADVPSEEEVAEALASITGGKTIKHCPSCTCEEP